MLAHPIEYVHTLCPRAHTIYTHSISDVCTYATVCRSKGKGKGKNKGKGKAGWKWNPTNRRWEQE